MVRGNSVIGWNVGVEGLGEFDFGSQSGTWMVKGTNGQ